MVQNYIGRSICGPAAYTLARALYVYGRRYIDGDSSPRANERVAWANERYSRDEQDIFDSVDLLPASLVVNHIHL